MTTQVDRSIPLCKVNPKFLHTNCTSHSWPFGAIAELIDNAYDPDVNAKQFWIDKTVANGQECLTFMDNGNGADAETMMKMLSFGFSNKPAIRGHQPIGMYGNGFKSGSMSLGRDAMVLSKSKNTCCIGMLSQTYLEEINAEQIVIPIVSFEDTNTRLRENQQDSLRDMLRYSPFKSERELLDEVNAIRPPFCPKGTGTRILIWNLRRTWNGKTDFDFETDRYDIRLPLETDTDQSFVPTCQYSLRAYCRILYLKPRLQMIIRGKKVQTQLVAKSLAMTLKDVYKPNAVKKNIPITFGYNAQNKDHCGIMIYHKNRLIKPYERVGCQRKGKGLGVVGIIQCDFLEPTHNKQDFLENDLHRKMITSLANKLEDYTNQIAHERKRKNPQNSRPTEDVVTKPDQNWVQCDECSRWRKLPDGIDMKKLGEKWFCRLNPDPQFRSCEVEQEDEDSGDEQPYKKTYRQEELETRKSEALKRTAQELQAFLKPPQSNTRSPSNNSTRVDLCTPSTSAGAPNRLRPILPISNQFALNTLTSTRGAATTAKRIRVTLDDNAGTSMCSSPASVISPNENDKTNRNAAGPSSAASASTHIPIPAAPVLGQHSSATQTMQHRIKIEREIDNEQDVIEVDPAGDGQAQMSVQDTGIPNSADRRPSFPEVQDLLTLQDVSEVQKQQNLVKIVTAERDLLDAKVVRLTAQLLSVQSRLEEQSLASIKQQAHQHSQTDKTEEDQNCRKQLGKIRQKLDELMSTEVGLNAAEAVPNSATSVENDLEKETDMVVCRVNQLMEELRQSKKKMEELHSQLRRLEEEKANELSKCEEEKANLSSKCAEEKADLLSKCEELRLQLQQQMSQPEHHLGGATASSSHTCRRLIELRQNVGLLLSYFLPALDQAQFNYECDVIDEILAQYLSENEIITSVAPRTNANR